MLSLWHDYLYVPLLNFLVFLYNNFAMENMAIAIIEMTILLRLLLLPFSLIVERNQSRYQKLSDKINEISAQYPKDSVEKNTAIRDVLRQNKVSPWASVILLLVQLGILLLLYQVFTGGIGKNLSVLYSSVERPETVNTILLGLDIAKKSFELSAFVAVLLFIKIILEQSRSKSVMTESNVVYRYMFPLMTFLFLAFLPSVKALFVLVSMFATALIHYLRVLWEMYFKKEEKKPEKEEKGKDKGSTNPDPWAKLKKKGA